jgi:hypothetical protein
MKVAARPRHIEVSSAALVPQSFTIDPGAKAFLLILDKIYTDKPLAVVREAAQNAYDAHREVGQSKPFVISLPTIIDPILLIRDYGPGMSREFMRDGYCRVTHSTKNESNTSVGGLGIGRLSMLAICDTYSVKSWHHGVETVYTVFLNEQRIPAIIEVSSNEAPQDASGVELQIPIPKNLVSDVQRAAIKALRDIPEGDVTVLNGTHIPTQYKYRTENIGFRMPHQAYSSQIRVLMGPMAYDMDIGHIRALDKTDNRDLRNFMRMIQGLDIFADIGAVEVSPGREGLD